MKHELLRAAFAAGAVLAAASGPVAAQTSGGNFVPFPDFLASLGQTRPEAMLSQSAGGVKSATAAEEMRQHLLRTYGGLTVTHSFVQDGQTFDCVPINAQPSVRHLGLNSVAAPPPEPPALATQETGGPRTIAATQQGKSAFDAFGNAERCETTTIPMRRMTMPELARFETLQRFFEKGPNGAGRVRVQDGDKATPPSYGGHTYAHEYQYVTNYGGTSTLSLYRPYVTTGSGEVFSLSQQWYVGGSGAGLQTAEVGIQNYPGKYGTENSVLFIYWTADDYNHTGCYNLDCGTFVQTNGTWSLGAGFANYSTVGGTQYDLKLGFRLYGGNWWLAVGNTWVGYYPGSLYKGGQLSKYAQIFDLGGETVGSTIWPPMGSGQFASAGWPRAAYHRTIKYRNASNTGFAPSLTMSQPWPACQTASAPSWGGSTWQTYFFLGGPGGHNC